MKGRELTTDHLLWAYRRGSFPMTIDEETDEVEFYTVSERCLFPVSGMRVSRSLRKTLLSGRFAVTFDTAFEEVITNCRRPNDNWISPEFIRVYHQAHQEGWAHSCEVWDAENQLVGGVYGLCLGTAFFAESMFHRQTDASKVALHRLIQRCKELGFTLFDAQIENEHLMSLGAYVIPHDDYIRQLNDALVNPPPVWRT